MKMECRQMSVALLGTGLNRPEQVKGFILFAFLFLYLAALNKIPSPHQTAARQRPRLRLGLLVAESGLSQVGLAVILILIAPISRLAQ
jgi:hypothetical protein